MKNVKNVEGLLTFTSTLRSAPIDRYLFANHSRQGGN
jgi:hypothetical protein